MLNSDSIDFELCQIDDPEINIETQPNKANFTLENFSYAQLLQDSIKQVSIDRFVIWNGNATVTNAKTQKIEQALSRINLKLFNWVINDESWANENKVYGAEGILLDLEKYSVVHRDNLHRLTVNNLKFDTRIKNLSTEYLSFSPLNTSTTSKNATLFDLSCIGIYLRDVNFHEALQNFKLDAAALRIKTPDLNIKAVQQNEKNNLASILAKNENQFNSIKIGQVEINDGYIKYESEGAQKTSFKSRFDVELLNIDTQRKTQNDSEQLFFAEDFSIQLAGTSYSMNDHLHQIAAESVAFSSKNEIASIDNFRIIANESEIADSVKFSKALKFTNVTIPNIKLNATNMHRLFTNRQLIAESLLFNQPRFSIDQYGVNTKSLSNVDFEKDLGVYLNNYLQKISVNRINLNEGVIYYTNFINGEQEKSWSNKFDLKLVEFNFPMEPNTTENNFLFSDNINLTLNNFNFDFPDGEHNLNIERINLDTEKNQLTLNEIKLFPDFNHNDFGNLAYKVVFTSPQATLSKFNLREFIKESNLKVGSVQLESPDVQFIYPEKAAKRNEAQPSDNPIDLKFQIGDLTIDRAAISLARVEAGENHTYSSIDFSSTINNVSFSTSGNTFNFYNLVFNSDYINYELNKNYYLNIGNLNYEQKSRKLQADHFYVGATKNLKTNATKDYYDFNIEQVALSAFDVLKLVKEQKFTGNILEIKAPSLSQKRIGEKQKSNFDPYHLELYKKLNKQLKEISFNKVVVNDGSYNIQNDHPKYIRNIEATGTGFNVDKYADSKELPLNFQTLKVDVSNLSGKTKNEYYNYSLRGLEFNSNGTINIRQLVLMPAYNRKEFFERKQYQDDYFNVNLNSAVIKGVDFNHLFLTDEFIAQELNCDFEKVNIFRDKRLTIHPEKRTKLPTAILRDLDQHLTINKASFSCDKLIYEEMEPQARKESNIFFTAIKGQAQHISNIDATVKNHPQCSLNLNGNLFGAGKMKVDMTFELPSPVDEFSFSATCGKMPLMLANTIAEPGLKLSIKDGINQKLEVNFIANEDSAYGNMRFYYNDLKVAVLGNKHGELKEQALISFVANTLVNSDNPRQPGKPVEMGYFINKRDKQRSIIQYCWRSIFEGMKPSIGMKEKD